MKIKFNILAVLLLSAFASTVYAARYTTIFTASNGFTEVTSIDGLVADPTQCYILASAENTGLYVGVGKYEEKPDWAGEDTKALRYRSADINPLYDLSNFFTIEKSGGYIGFRNMYYHTSLFQTHDNAGFMYVLTYTEPTMNEWCYLTPTFQDGYWLFESGKYPISSGNWACGYLGPWNRVVSKDEPIALNRRNTPGDEAGHYRLFRIAKTDLVALHNTLLQSISAGSPVDVTERIVNPSFETGDETGWTLIGKDPNGNDEFTVRDYWMSNRDGNYLMNAYQWWASYLGVSQTVTNVPSGTYELSAVVASWAGRTVSFSGNGVTTSATGSGDATGIPVSLTVNMGLKGELKISAGSTTDWWSEGDHGADDNKCFFKIDNVRMRWKGAYLSAYAIPLHNDNTTRLVPGLWYFYDAPCHTQYTLRGPLDGLVYTTDADKVLSQVTTSPAARTVTLPVGRVFFKTTRSDATLSITPERTLQQGTFTAVALNVDGLPKTINYGVGHYDLNPDGPGEEGTKKISAYLSEKNYDFIGCSEDFNYNGSLMSQIEDRYWCGTIRNTLSLSGLDWLKLLQGNLHVETDGLNLIWKFDKVSATGESWTRWNDTEATDGNHYVEKGYRHYDMQIDDGPIIDVYILHMDAGDTNATWSRESQWRQLADAINASDHSRAKLIIGDTNSRWTREDIISNFNNRLHSDFDMSDVWVEFYQDGIYPTTAMGNLTDQTDPTDYSKYEIVDKIIYINPKAANTVRLIPQSFRIEQDYTYGNVDGTDDTTPLGDHRPVVVTFSYIAPGDLNPQTVDILDNSSNAETLTSTYGILANVSLQNRRFYKDGSWNTLVLPFPLTIEGSPLDGADVRAFESSEFENGELILNFSASSLTDLEAGKPYLIKWNRAPDYINNDAHNIVSPLFPSVTIDGSVLNNPVVETDYVDFVGNFSPLTLSGGDNSVLYLGSLNKLYTPTSDRNIKSCRGYFQLKNDLTIGNSPLQAKSFRMSFGDEETTGFFDVRGEMEEGRWEKEDVRSKKGWFTLQGIKLDAEPTTPGIYIKDGEKIIK